MLPNRRSGSLAAFFVLSLLLCPDHSLSASQPGDIEKKIESERAELQRLRRAISAERGKISRLAESEKSILQKMQDVTKALDLQKRELKTWKRELALNRRKAMETEKKLKEISARAADRKARLGRRIRALYKEGEFSYLKVIFSSEDLTDMTRRITYMRKIAESDARLLKETVSTREKLERTGKELLGARRQLREAGQKVLSRKRRYQREREARNRFLQKIRSKKSLVAKTLKELETASRSVRELIRKLGKTYGNKISLLAFPGLGRNLPWPVRGKVISSYGKHYSPQYKIFTFNNGITIRSRSLEGVKAVAEGKVLFADWLKGYGRLLIIGHGKGYHSLYGYLDDFLVKVGSRVKKGQLVAEVGESGPRRGPSLYFEIRRRGKPGNPLNWLSKLNP